MDDLENIVGQTEATSFLARFKDEVLATGRLYLELARNPLLLGRGVYRVVRDVGYELPRSLLRRSDPESLEDGLNRRASQSLAFSELATVPGTYAGVVALSLCGADDYTACIVGGTAGNYLSAVASYLGAYTALTRGREEYPAGLAVGDGLRVVKDGLPMAAAVYATEAPILGGLLAAGMSPNAAVTLNLMLGMVLFLGVAKHSAARNLQRG